MAIAPKYVYQAIAMLAADLVNTSAAGKSSVHRILFGAYKSMCLAQVRAGVRDPFLPETLGDFEDDTRAQITFYKRALSMAAAEGEPKCTILLALAETYARQRDTDKARRALEAAIADAKRHRDKDCLAEAAAAMGRFPKLAKADKANSHAPAAEAEWDDCLLQDMRGDRCGRFWFRCQLPSHWF
jgi:tetratricopeptide (TPR) repeat protein